MSNLYAVDNMGTEFKTKAALRRFIAEHPDDVLFTDTSAFDNRGSWHGISNWRATDVIVGPNPWNNRKWYANIINGKVV